MSKKKINFALLLFFLINYVTINAQFLTQSAEGKSSIPLPLNGLGVGLDITKAEIALGINNYQSALNGKRNYFIGLNVTGKNSDGVASLFSSGDIVPEGNLLGFAGLTFSNYKTIARKFSSSQAMEIIKKNISFENEIFNSFKRKMYYEVTGLLTYIVDAGLTPTQLATLKQNIIDDIQRKISTRQGIDPGDSTGMEEVGKRYSYGTTTDLTEFKKNLEVLYEKNKAIYVQEMKERLGDYYKIYSAAHSDFLDSQKPWRTTIFLQGGINARSFTRFLGIATPDFSKSFQDTLFRGGVFGLGVNFQYKNYWLGITYSYIDGDNFMALKSKKYTYRLTDTSGNQTLYRDKEITGYSGKYAKVETNQLNIDIVGDFKLSDTSRLLANIYLRGSVFSRDTAFLKNYINIGVGAYFINKKGKFLGGVYAELPDVNNNFEKAKPANEINISSPFKKLSFGIVTKFTLSSIFGWSNRPAKPD